MLVDTRSCARWAWRAGALGALLAFAAWSGCGGQTVVEDGTAGGGGSAGGGTTTWTTSTTSWTTTTSTTWWTTTTPRNCPPASTPGCCYGDGGCCSCVAKVCDDWAMGDDPGVQELTACVCQPQVCAGACAAACAANGIEDTCQPCVEVAVQSTCLEEYLMCLGE